MFTGFDVRIFCENRQKTISPPCGKQVDFFRPVRYTGNNATGNPYLCRRFPYVLVRPF